MNTPQLKDGYIQIACGSKDNDVISALVKAGLNGTEWEVVMIVIRKTWGYKKVEDKISLSQFADMGTKSRRYYIKAINSLVNKKVLVKNSSLVDEINGYSFNKRFKEWVVNNSSPSEQNDTEVVNNSSPTKRNSYKKKYINTTNVVLEASPQGRVSEPQSISLKENSNSTPPSSAAPPSYGRQDITQMLIALKRAVGIEAFADGSMERNFGRHLVDLLSRVGRDEFRRRLDFVLGDDFKRKNCNRIKYLYAEMKSVPIKNIKPVTVKI